MIKKIFYLIIILHLMPSEIYSQNFLLSNSLTGTSTVRTVELKKVSDGILVYGDFTGTLNTPGSNTANARDIFLAKYDNNFELVWFQQIGGTSLDFAYDLVVHDNYVYLVGTYLGTCTFDGGTEELTAIGTKFDAFLAKFKLDGTFIWAKPYAYNDAIQYATTIDVDKNDDLLIGGYYSDSITFESEKFISSNGMFFSKADTSGSITWAENIPTDNTSTKLQAVSAFDDGYYFTGNLEGSATFDIGGITSNDASYSDVFLYKTSFDGTGSWLRRSYGYGSADTKTGTITGDEYGNIYYTGLYGGTYIEVDSTNLLKSNKTLVNNGSFDAFIFKYNKTGNLIWHYNYGDAGREWARGIQYRNGFLYLTGYFSDTLFVENDTLVSSDPDDYDAILAMFDSDGNLLRAAQVEDSNDGTTSGTILSVDDENNAYWGGDFKASQINIGDSTFNLTGTQAIFISKYKPTFTVAFTKKQNVTCNGGNDGELIVTPYFGVPPFNYSWSHDGGLNDSTATSISAGTYFVTVTDALDSTDVTQYTLSEPGAFIFNADTTHVTTCSYSTEGAIDLNVTGGNGGNTYYWTASNGGSISFPTAEDQTLLRKGQYDVTVTDSEGCTGDTTINITGPQEMHFGNSDTTSYHGAGSEGAIDLEVTGGTGTPSLYSASWTGPDGYTNTVQDINTLQPGTYCVTVTDDNGCTGDTCFVVVNKFEFSSYIESKKDACNGVSDGRATVNYYSPVGHTNITYQWDANAGNQVTAEASNLAGSLAGMKYYVTVTDTEEEPDVSIVDSVVIYEFSYTFSGSLIVTGVDCKGDCDGDIILTITEDGAFPYAYNWSTTATSQNINELCAGFYSVTATDDNECTFLFNNIEITEPEFDLTVPTPEIISNILCNGDLNGALKANPAGGNGSYSYLWNDPGNQTSQTITGLDARFYTVTVTDFKGCSASSGVNLTEPDALTVSGITGDLICFNDNNGTIALTVGGGTPPYSYFWTSTDGSGIVAVDKNQSGLSGGSYEVTVTDGNSCEIADTFIVIEPTELQITNEEKTDVTDCNGDNTGTITITASGGTGVLTYTLNPGAIQTNNTGAFTGIGAGTYTVDVDDASSCGPVNSSSIEIAEPTAISLQSSNAVNPTCFGLTDGSIDVTITGGTIATDYTYEWSTADGSGLVADSEDQTGLSAGTYDLTVTDDNSCASVFAIVLDDPAEITIDSENSTDASSQTRADGTITIAASGGTGTLTYDLNPGEDSNETGVFNGLLPGDYTVDVTDDNSCGPVTSNTITVSFPDAIEDIIVNDKIKIYPNPTSDKIFIDIDYDYNHLNLEVLSISGQVLLKKEIESHGITKEELDLSNYPKGVYFIRIYNNQLNFKEKILLQ